MAIAARARADVEQTRDTLKLDYILVPGPIPDLYRRYGVANPTNDRVPLPATFIVDRAGTVRWQYVGTTDRDRPRVDVVLAQLRALR